MITFKETPVKRTKLTEQEKREYQEYKENHIKNPGWETGKPYGPHAWKHYIGPKSEGEKQRDKEHEQKHWGKGEGNKDGDTK